MPKATSFARTHAMNVSSLDASDASARKHETV
jgi:hypothetical protein